MKSSKFLTILGYVLKCAISVSGVVFLIITFASGEQGSKVWRSIATIVLPFLPDFLRLIGLKVSRRLEIWYYIFLIAALVVGMDLELYKHSYWYDKVVHGSSGTLMVFVAREILEQASGNPDKLWFKALFAMGMVALSAVLWECFEFAADQLLGQSMQQLISVGVEDTMWDMISATTGGIIGIVIAFPVKRVRK
ncbi:DUF2238 domain-containing protein [Candidatus Saccharibacteria bacterium]|nr:DUF2238 domain-containing protein [Candidatus Saccharibacteria bacterium]